MTFNDIQILSDYLNIHGDIQIDEFSKPEFFYDANNDGSVTQEDLSILVGLLNTNLVPTIQSLSDGQKVFVKAMASKLRETTISVAPTLSQQRLARTARQSVQIVPQIVTTQSQSCTPTVFKIDIGTLIGNPYNGSGGSFQLRFYANPGEILTDPIEVPNSRINRLSSFFGESPDIEYSIMADNIKQAIINVYNSNAGWPTLGQSDVLVEYAYTDMHINGQFKVSIMIAPTDGVIRLETYGGRLTIFATNGNGLFYEANACPNLITAHTDDIALPPGTISAKLIDFKGFPGDLENFGTPDFLYKLISGKIVIQFRKISDINSGNYWNYVETTEIDVISTSMFQLENLLNSTMSIPVLGVPNGFVVGSTTTNNMTDHLNDNRFWIGVRSTVLTPVPDSQDLFEFRVVDAISVNPGWINLNLLETGDCSISIAENPCQISNINVSLEYDKLPKRPINIYSCYMKYVLRDYITPTIKGTVFVPINKWSGLNQSYNTTPCSFWISNLLTSPSYNTYNYITNVGDIINVANNDKFITPVMGIDGQPTIITSSVDLPDDPNVFGRLVSGDPRCTKTKTESGYTACVIESMEILMLSAVANNISSTPPFITEFFDKQIIYFDPSNCQGLDLMFMIDNSGSMGRTIDNVKASIDSIIDIVASISPQSTIGLSRYGYGAGLGLPEVIITQTPVDSDENKQTIRDAVNSMSAGGNYEPQWLAIRHGNLWLSSMPPGKTRLLVLVTDQNMNGNPNVGSQANAEAEARICETNDITIFTIQTDSNPSYEFMVSVAQITHGAALQQYDGAFTEPLAQLLQTFCLSSVNTSIETVVSKNQCEDLPNPASLGISLSFEAQGYQGIQSFNHSITDIEFLQTTGNALYWSYTAPSNLLYRSLPTGNWYNYPNISKQGIEMQLARWEGFKLFTDLPDGSGAVQCSSSNIRLINGKCEFNIDSISLEGKTGNTVLKCLTTIIVDVIETGGDGIPAQQIVTIDNATGGYWKAQVGNISLNEITEQIGWDLSTTDMQTIFEMLPSIGAGNVVVNGGFPIYTITFDVSLGVIPRMIVSNFLTCTNEAITFVPNAPYPYDIKKPGPNLNPDQQNISCDYCEPIITNKIKFHTEGISSGCDTKTRSLACKFTKTPSGYAYYKFINNRLLELTADYEAVPGDKIVLLNKSIPITNISLQRVARSFAIKL